MEEARVRERGGRVERKEDGKIGLQAIVFNFSYVMEVFMRRGGRTLYTLKCHDEGEVWTQVHYPHLGGRGRVVGRGRARSKVVNSGLDKQGGTDTLEKGMHRMPNFYSIK